MKRSKYQIFSYSDEKIDESFTNDLKSTADSALKSHNIKSIQDLSSTEIIQWQILLRHGEKFGYWITPKEWYPTGKQSNLNVDIKRRITDLLNKYTDIAKISACENLPTLIDAAVLSISRYLILCRVGPVGFRSSYEEPLGPTRLSDFSYRLLPLMVALSIREAITLEPKKYLHNSSPLGCFQFLKSSALDNLSASPVIIKNIRNEIRRMQVLEQKGLWCDAPPWKVNIEKLTEVSGESNKNKPEIKVDPHLPLPDDFVSQMGQRSLWLIEQLAPNILRALSDFQILWKRAAAAGKDRAFLGRICKEHLASFKWTDANGNLLAKPLFELRLTTHGEGKKIIPLTDDFTDEAVWPPKNMSHIFGLARIIQGAHYFIISLSTTARVGESIMFNRSCVVYEKNGTYKAEGRTFKLVKRADGELRTWALPPLAAIAIEQQARLVALYERLGSGEKAIDPDTVSPSIHLWGQVGGSVSERSKPMSANGLNNLFVSFALALGMDSRPGGQLVRSHRFRKTIARLVALALTSAPKVLQDVFGHKSIEMTMYYILTDKDLVAEIDTIAKELRVMRATEVVSKMVDAEDSAENSDVNEKEKVKTNTLFGGYGGPAALRIRAAIDEHKTVVFRRGEDFNASSIRELAEVLTMQGKDWQVVRAGVLCTKSAGQSGPCNKKKGKPEPSRCDTDCDFRLEEAWHQQDVDECIAEAVRLYIEETDRQEDLVASLWAGQIRAHVLRFPALKEKWMKDPTVQAVMNEEFPI